MLLWRLGEAAVRSLGRAQNRAWAAKAALVNLDVVLVTRGVVLVDLDVAAAGVVLAVVAVVAAVVPHMHRGIYFMR